MAVDLHLKVYRVDERPLPVYREVQAGFFGRVSLRATRLRLAVDADSYAIVTHHAAQRDYRGRYTDCIASREARAIISTRRSHKPALVAPAGEPADPRRGLQLQELGKLNASIPGLDALLVQKYLHVTEVAMKSFLRVPSSSYRTTVFIRFSKGSSCFVWPLRSWIWCNGVWW
jgi:hypothetical protein